MGTETERGRGPSHGGKMKDKKCPHCGTKWICNCPVDAPNSVQKAEQAVKNAQSQLDSCEGWTRNAKRLLDQALKELEKAKKLRNTEVFDCSEGLRLAVVNNHQRSDTVYILDYPCKVTVRPLGGPALCEEIVCGDRSLNIATQTLYRAGFRDGDVLRIAVELA